MSKIQWCDITWNPMVGCSIPSIVVGGKRRARVGCANCYACKDSPHRFAETYDREGVVILRGNATREGLTYVPRSPSGKSLGKGAQWTGEVRLLPWALDVPLRRRKPTRFLTKRPDKAIEWGSRPVIVGRTRNVSLNLRSSKGGDPEEWPEDLRVREMPGGADHA